MATLTQRIHQLRTNRSLQGSAEQQWIDHQLTDPQLKAATRQLSIVALHILSALEAGELTGIDLAQALTVTRGGITRAAKKLLAAGLIQVQNHPNDHKKIYYALTPPGAQIAHVHDQMHAAIQQSIADRLAAKYSAADLQTVANFLQDWNDLETQFGDPDA